MSDYTKTVDFAAKDALATGDPNKLGKGTEVDTEFDNIETAIATKANKVSPPVNGDLIVQTSTGDIEGAGYSMANINADITASDEEFNRLVGVTSAIQTQLDSKAASTDNGVAHKGCLVYRSTDLTTVTGGNYFIEFDSEAYDTDGIHDTSTNPDRLVVPSGVTKVRLTARITWDANGTGRRLLVFGKNASTFVGGVTREDEPPSSSFKHSLFGQTGIVECVAGDYFRLTAIQNSGGNLDLDSAGGIHTWFAMEIIE